MDEEEEEEEEEEEKGVSTENCTLFSLEDCAGITWSCTRLLPVGCDELASAAHEDTSPLLADTL